MTHLRKLLLSTAASLAVLTGFAQADLTAVPDRNRDAAEKYIDAVKARMLDDPRQEEALLKEVIKQRPDEAAPYYDLARLYRKQRRYDLSEYYVKQAIERNPDNLWYKAEYAEILEAQNKPEQAAGVYRELAEKQRFNKEYIIQAARLYEAAGKYKEAIALMDQLIQKVGNDDILLVQKQQLYLRMNDLDGAAKVAQQLIDLNPQEGRYYSNLAELYNSNDQAAKALAIYEKAIKQFPNDPNVQYGMALYYKGQKNNARYDEMMQQAILNKELDEEAQATLLFGYLQDLATDSIRKKSSIGITRKLAEQHPNSAQLANLYGEVLIDNDVPELATEQFRKSVALDPSRFIAWQRLLFSFTEPKDADSLIKWSQTAMRYFPNQALVHYLNGIGHFNKKSFPAAIKSVSRAIDLQPEENKLLLADMHAILGDINNAAGNYSASDASYDEALRLNPENPTALNNYAYYLSLRGARLNDAERMSKKSLTIRPDEPTFLDTYGWILYKQGNYQKAKEYIERALQKNQNADGTLYEHLGDIHYKLNDKEKALELWKTAKEKGTDNTLIDKKIQEKKLYE